MSPLPSPRSDTCSRRFSHCAEAIGIELCVVAAGDDQQCIDALGQRRLVVAEAVTRLLQELSRFPDASSEQIQDVRIGEHGVRSPRRIVQRGDCLREVLSGGRGVRVRLGEAELAEDLGAILTLGRLFESATEVGGCRLWGALCERALGCAAECRDEEAIA